jgi:hypothetical protein
MFQIVLIFKIFRVLKLFVPKTKIVITFFSPLFVKEHEVIFLYLLEEDILFRVPSLDGTRSFFKERAKEE